MEQNVCQDQETFNNAFKTALDGYEKEKEDVTLTSKEIAVYVLYSIAMIVFLVWAIYLVSKEKKNDERVIHFLYATILSPIYVLSYYFNEVF